MTKLMSGKKGPSRTIKYRARAIKGDRTCTASWSSAPRLRLRAVIGMGGSGAGIGAGAVMGAAVNGVADEADVKGVDDVAWVDDVAVEMQASEGTRVVVGTRVGMGACAPATAPANGSLAPPRAPLGNGSAV